MDEGIIDINHTLVYYDHRDESSKTGCYFNVHTPKMEAGVSIKMMQDTLGHADISATLNIYTDVTRELKKSEFTGRDTYFETDEPLAIHLAVCYTVLTSKHLIYITYITSYINQNRLGKGNRRVM